MYKLPFIFSCWPMGILLIKVVWMDVFSFPPTVYLYIKNRWSQRLRNQAATAAENLQTQAFFFFFFFFRPLRTFWAYLTVESSRCVWRKCRQDRASVAKGCYDKPCSRRFIWPMNNPMIQCLNTCLSHWLLNGSHWREAGDGEIETKSMVFEKD